MPEALAKQFLQVAHTPAAAFYELVQTRLIPAASAGDETAIAAALRALDEAYRAHRQAIEVVVRTAQQANVRAEAMLLGVPFVPVTDEDRATQTKDDWQLPDTVNFLLTNDK